MNLFYPLAKAVIRRSSVFFLLLLLLLRLHLHASVTGWNGKVTLLQASELQLHSSNRSPCPAGQEEKHDEGERARWEVDQTGFEEEKERERGSRKIHEQVNSHTTVMMNGKLMRLTKWYSERKRGGKKRKNYFEGQNMRREMCLCKKVRVWRGEKMSCMNIHTFRVTVWLV